VYNSGAIVKQHKAFTISDWNETPPFLHNKGLDTGLKRRSYVLCGHSYHKEITIE